MAAFDGLDLGMIEEMTTAPNAKARQVNGYMGLNGLECLDGGTRGLTTSVRGVLFAPDLPTLGAFKQALGGYELDGGQYLLIDADGTGWFGVILTGFKPYGPRRWVNGYTLVCQRYEAEFLHVNS